MYQLRVRRQSLEVSLVSLNAALYAGFGYLTHIGLFAPVFGTVRFWPAVIIPAAFSILFSPRVGGLGAAIGIFVSDMLIHGNPLLSISVGVPANFVAFYLIGYLAGKMGIAGTRRFALLILAHAIPLICAVGIYLGLLLDEFAASLFLALSIIVFASALVAALLRREYFNILQASSIGLMVGSWIIGLGLWAYSQFWALPLSGAENAPLIAIIIWFLWTYLTEIPFLYIFLPPLIRALGKMSFTSFGPR